MRTFFKSTVAALALSALLTACGGKDDTAATPSPASDAPSQMAAAETAQSSRDVIPHAQLPENVVPSAYAIELTIDPEQDAMQGRVKIDVDIEEASDHIWIHAKNIEDAKAVITYEDGDEAKLAFTVMSDADAPSGLARLDGDIKAGKASITITYITPYNLSLNSAYKVVRGDDNYIVTQFEPLGAREAFPSFDEPKYKVPFDLTIISTPGNKVFANTPVKETSEFISETGPNRGVTQTAYTFETTRPLPTYLLAFAVGPYEVVDFGDLPPTDIRKRPLRLRGIAAKGEGKNLDYALENTAGILTALEEYFGMEYPYEKLDLLAAPDYAFGAMENPGLIVYREYLLLLSDDAPLSQKRSYAGVHSHELAHQWFGNLVTPVWWEDIWLNEAFATWMGNKGTDAWQPEGNFDRNTLRASLGAMNIDTLSTTRSVREPLERSENVMEQFDGITYRKGGGVLSMFESFVGEEAFRDGVRLHMERYKDDVATADDFFQSIADGSKNPDVVSAMKSFVDQPGVPIVNANVLCETEAVKIAGLTEMDLFQARYAPLGSKTQQGQSWEIPVCVKFGFGDDVVKQCTLMKDKRTAMIPSHESGECADWVMPNPDGAGYYRFSLDSTSWENLLNNLDKLNTKEVLAAQDSLNAAFRAGDVEASVYLKGMEVFAKHPEYDVASGAGGGLGLFDNFLGDDYEDAIGKLTRDMFAERYKKIVGTDTVEGDLLAPTLAARLIGYGQDEDLRAEFAAKGAKYLGLDGTPDKSAVASNMLSRALRTVMEARPDDAYQPLLDMVSKGSSFEKGAAIGALGSTKDKAIAAKLRDLSLNGETEMTGRQASSMVAVLIGSDMHGDDTWEWMKTNFDAFVEKRVPDVRKPSMPNYGQGCSIEERDNVEAFFTSKADVIPGYERNLAQTLESIELCAALKDAVAEDLGKALKAR